MSYMHNRVKSITFLIICLGVVLIAAPSGSAQEKDALRVIEVTGSGAISGSNITSAREQAISSSLVSAVASACLDFMPLNEQNENFELLNQALYDQVGQFVQDYKVMTEFVAPSQYRVVVRASVMMDKVKEQLANSGVLLTEKVIPRILFFVAEQNLEDVQPRYWWGENLVFVVPSSEEAMGEILRKEGFDIVTRSNVDKPLNHDLNISIDQAIAIARHLTADLVIIGSSKAEKTSNVMGGTVKSYKGTVAMRVFRTDTGAETASATRAAVSAGESDVLGGREALSNAGALVGEELASQIISASEKAASLVPSVEIVVVGTSELRNFVKFRKILGTVSGVSGINIKEIKPDESTISVDYSGTGDSLAEALMLKTYDSFGIDIYEVSPDRLGIELINE